MICEHFELFVKRSQRALDEVLKPLLDISVNDPLWISPLER